MRNHQPIPDVMGGGAVDSLEAIRVSNCDKHRLQDEFSVECGECEVVCSS
jgi:hypothetical protein